MAGAQLKLRTTNYYYSSNSMRPPTTKSEVQNLVTMDAYLNTRSFLSRNYIWKSMFFAVRKFIENYTFNSRITKHQKNNCINH